MARPTTEAARAPAVGAALGVIALVGLMLAGSPTLAADGPLISDAFGGYALVAMGIAGFAFALWPRRDRSSDPHDAAYGDHPSLPNRPDRSPR